MWSRHVVQDGHTSLTGRGVIERGVTSALTDNVAIIASAQKISPLNSWTVFTRPWKVGIGLSWRTPPVGPRLC